MLFRDFKLHVRLTSRSAMIIRRTLPDIDRLKFLRSLFRLGFHSRHNILRHIVFGCRSFVPVFVLQTRLVTMQPFFQPI